MNVLALVRAVMLPRLGPLVIQGIMGAALLSLPTNREARGQSTPLIYEGFDYTVGSTLASNTPPWSSLNTGTAPVVTAGNLSVTGLAAPTGDRGTWLSGNIQEAILTLPAPQTTGTVYFSFPFQLSSVPTTATYSFGLVGQASTTYGSTVWLRADSDGFNIGFTNRTGTATYDPTRFALNNTIFLVGAYEFIGSGTTNDAARLWINPSSATFGGESIPIATLSAAGGTSDMTSVSGFLLRGASGSPAGTFDELRIGTSWASVTPAFVAPAAQLFWSSNGTDAGGSGTWTAAGPNWSTSGSAPFSAIWNSDAVAVFGATSGTVMVDSAGITAASGLSIQSNGYEIAGGTLTLGGSSSTITVATAATGTISASITGSNGLTKNGEGLLFLASTNSFSGNVIVSGGTLQINADSALGNSANNIELNNGILKTTTDTILSVDRDVTGFGALDIAPGTALNISGAANLSATVLASSGTLVLSGSGRTIGTLTLDTAATIDGAGPVGIANITASGVTSGTAAIGPSIEFFAGDRNVSVGTGGTLLLDGDIFGSTGRMVKTGAGTLIVSGSSSASLRIGATGSTPIDGGTVIIGSALSSGTSQIQLNYGTLQADADGGLTLANGVSLAGRSGAVAVLGGLDSLTFSGSSSFFRGTGTSGALRVDIDNDTEFAGDFGATGGSGTATGITLGGSGLLTFSGNASALVDPITLQDSLDLLVSGTLGSAVTVGAGNVLGGDGTILGNLTFASGSDFLFEIGKTLTVNGATVSFGDFGITDLIGFSASVPDGSYTLIDGTADIVTDNLRNFGLENAFDLGGGRKAYFSESSLVVNVVPEPSSAALAGLGGLCAAGYAVRRRLRRA